MFDLSAPLHPGAKRAVIDGPLPVTLGVVKHLQTFVAVRETGYCRTNGHPPPIN